MRILVTSFWVVLATIVCVDCGGTASPNNVVAKAPPFSLPCVYSSRSKPGPLSQKQFDDIHWLIEQKGKEVGVPRFIFVHCSDPTLFINVDVYFVPDHREGRVVSGKMIAIAPIGTVKEQRDTSARLGGNWPYVRDYVQITDGTAAIPNEQDVPFLQPEGLSNQDILTVVDAARAIENRQQPGVAAPRVLGIKTSEDHHVHVSLGWRDGMLDGTGTDVDLQRIDGVWVVQSAERWDS